MERGGQPFFLINRVTLCNMNIGAQPYCITWTGQSYSFLNKLFIVFLFILLLIH